MTEQQLAAFQAGSLTPAGTVYYFCVGLFFVMLLTWSAWTLIDIYRGVITGATTLPRLWFALGRIALILLISLSFIL